jgi:hypothetical protein
VLTLFSKFQFQRIASVTKRLSIEIIVTEDDLKKGTFEINRGSWTLYEKKTKKQDEWEPTIFLTSALDEGEWSA